MTDTYSLVQQNYFDLQRKAEKDCLDNIEKLYVKHPQLKEITSAISKTNSKLIRLSLKHEPVSAELENELARLKAQKLDYIEEHNIDMSIFKPKYACPDCKDTGKLPDGSRCHCFNDYYARFKFGNEEMKILERENFSTFRTDIFPELAEDGSEQRKTMEHIRDALTDYCNKFPEVPRKNILVSGLCGTGKSFLLNCCAKALSDRKFSVIKITSFKMMNDLFDLFISDSVGFNAEVERLCQVDVLLIDDLGAELMKDNFTLNTLFNILDRRFELDKAVIISTNLSVKKLEEKYSDRIMSRLLNKHTTNRILLKGIDVRVKPDA